MKLDIMMTTSSYCNNQCSLCEPLGRCGDRWTDLAGAAVATQLGGRKAGGKVVKLKLYD